MFGAITLMVNANPATAPPTIVTVRMPHKFTCKRIMIEEAKSLIRLYKSKGKIKGSLHLMTQPLQADFTPNCLLDNKLCF